MQNDMIERVARVIAYHLHDQRSDKVEKVFSKPTHAIVARAYRLIARAAIEAMREPTGEMKDAGAETFGLPKNGIYIGPIPKDTLDGQPSKAWRAMIDEILREDPATASAPSGE